MIGRNGVLLPLNAETRLQAGDTVLTQSAGNDDDSLFSGG